MSEQAFPQQRGRGGRSGRGGRGGRGGGFRPIRLSRTVSIVNEPKYSDTTVVVLRLPAECEEEVRKDAEAVGTVSKFNSASTRFSGQKFEVTFESAEDAASFVETENDKEFGDIDARVVLKRVGFTLMKVTRVPDDDNIDDKSVFVGGVRDMSDDDIRALFTNPKDFRRPRDFFALVSFETSDEAAAACGQKTVGENEVRIEMSRPPFKKESTEVRKFEVHNKLLLFRTADVPDEVLNEELAKYGEVTNYDRQRSHVVVEFSTASEASKARRGLSRAQLIDDCPPMIVRVYSDYLTPEEFEERVQDSRAQRQQNRESNRKNIRENKSEKKAAPRRAPAAPAVELTDEEQEKLDRTVFVRALVSINDDDLKGFFNPEAIEDFLRIRGNARITFSSAEETANAMNQEGTNIDDTGKVLHVEKARPWRKREPREPREPADPNNRVFFARIPRSAKREDLLEKFAGLQRVIFTRFGRGILVFDTVENAQEAVNCNGEAVFGGEYPMRFEFAHPRTNRRRHRSRRHD